MSERTSTKTGIADHVAARCRHKDCFLEKSTASPTRNCSKRLAAVAQACDECHRQPGPSAASHVQNYPVLALLQSQRLGCGRVIVRLPLLCPVCGPFFGPRRGAGFHHDLPFPPEPYGVQSSQATAGQTQPLVISLMGSPLALPGVSDCQRGL